MGGEPLLRSDFVEIVGAIDQSRSGLVLFTNGSLLAEQAPRLRRAGLNRVYVSLDYPDARHDELTGHPGLFEKALAGIRGCLDTGMLVGISATITERVTPGDVRRLIELGAELNIHELFLSPRIGQESTADIEGERFRRIAQESNASPALKPGIFFYPTFVGEAGYGCAAGATRMYVDCCGNVSPCDGIGEIFGSVRKEPLQRAWYRMVSDPRFQSAGLGGCRCVGQESRCSIG